MKYKEACWVVVAGISAYFGIERLFIVPQLGPADFTTKFKDFAHIWVGVLVGVSGSLIAVSKIMPMCLGRGSAESERFSLRSFRCGLIVAAIAVGLIAFEGWAFFFQKNHQIATPLISR
jgi:hypothetical protein